MIKRDFVVLVIAVMCGVAAFMFILNFLKEAAQPKREFVVAAQAIPKDQTIGKRDVRFSKPMKNITPEDLFLQIDDVIGSRALEDIPQGKLIHRSKVERQVAAPPAPSKGTLPIPKGMKALTISASGAERLPDLLDIGSYVDALGRLANYEGKMEMKTILRGAQVLSLERSKDLGIKSITIALSPNEAEAMLDAMSQGKILIVASSEQGEKPAYQVSWGTIEIIRGVSKQPKVAFGKGAESSEGKSAS